METPPSPGGCTFAEDPALPAPHARIIWDAGLDPGTLRARVTRVPPDHPDALDPDLIEPWLSIVDDGDGQHAVLSDGWHRLRLDLIGDNLRSGPVLLSYEIVGIVTASSKLLPLRRSSISACVAVRRAALSRRPAGRALAARPARPRRPGRRCQPG